MLRGISPLLSPDLLKLLCEMGHGDEIVLADAHYPGAENARVLRCDGIAIAPLLDAIAPLFELDAYEPPLYMMAIVPGDTLDPAVERDYLAAIRRHEPDAPAPVRLERFAFYERSRKAFAILLTGEQRTYGNIILKKGVTGYKARRAAK